jgi:hypothetical protein
MTRAELTAAITIVVPVAATAATARTTTIAVVPVAPTATVLDRPDRANRDGHHPFVASPTCDLSHRRARSRPVEESLPCWLLAEQLVINPGQ